MSTQLSVKVRASWMMFSSSIENWLSAGFCAICLVFLLVIILLRICQGKFTMYSDRIMSIMMDGKNLDNYYINRMNSLTILFF